VVAISQNKDLLLKHEMNKKKNSFVVFSCDHDDQVNSKELKEGKDSKTDSTCNLQKSYKQYRKSELRGEILLQIGKCKI